MKQQMELASVSEGDHQVNIDSKCFVENFTKQISKDWRHWEQ